MPCVQLPLFPLLRLFPLREAEEWDLGSSEQREAWERPLPWPQLRANPHSPLWGLQVVVATAISGSYKMPKKYHMQIVGEIQHG